MKYLIIKLAKLELTFDDTVELIPYYIPCNESETKFLNDQLGFILEKLPKYKINNKPLKDQVYRYAERISNLTINQRFEAFGSTAMDYWSTSPVIEILNNNLFITKNSVYFIQDENIRLMLVRDFKLNNLI